MIYNEDCLEGMKKLADGSVDLTVTSPPYDSQRTFDGYAKAFIFQPTAQELYRVTKKGGVVVWVVNDMVLNGSETGTSFKQALYFKDIGFNLHDTMIWQKSGYQFSETNRYYPIFEYMFVLSKGKPKTANLIRDRENLSFGRDNIHGTYRQSDGSFKRPSKPGRPIPQYGVRWNIWKVTPTHGQKTGTPRRFHLNLQKTT